MRAQTAAVPARLFQRVRHRAPIAGALFGVNETIPGRNHVAILSHALWNAIFRWERSDALGATIRINGVPYTVTGIMPRDSPCQETRRFGYR